MNVYAQLGLNFQQIGGECPPGFLIMKSVRPENKDYADYVAQADGTWAVDPRLVYTRLARVESDWRDAQMPIARENVTAIEYGDTSLPGTAAEWRAYWLALRSWVDGAEGYPYVAHRPTSP